METASKKNESLKMYIILAIGACIMFLGGKITPFGQVTEYGMYVFGVFLGCIFTWLFGYLAQGSIMGLLFFALYVPGNSAGANIPGAFGNFNWVMIVFCLLFCYGLEKSGLLSYIANLFLSAKFARKSPLFFALALWLAAIACTAIITNSLASMLVLYGIFYEMSNRVDFLKKRDPYTVYLMVIMTAFAAICIALLPYSPSLWMPLGIMQSVAPQIVDIPIITICAVNWLVVGLMLLFALILLKVFLMTGFMKPDFKLSGDVEIVKKEDLKITKGIKWGFVYVAIIMFALVGANLIPATNPVGAFLSKAGVIGSFMFVVWLMCVTTIDGKPLMSFEEAISKAPWSILAMLLAALTIAATLGSPAAGFTATMSEFITTKMSGVSPMLMAFVLLAFTLALTNCINNAVAIQICFPLLTTLLVAINVNPVIFAGLAAVLVEHGNIMPSGSPLGAYMHGNSEWMSSGQVYLYASIGALMLLIATAICMPIMFAL